MWTASPQYESIYVFFKVLLCENPTQHFLHLYGFSTVWVCRCFFFKFCSTLVTSVWLFSSTCAHTVFKMSVLWKYCFTLITSKCLFNTMLAHIVYEVTALNKSCFYCSVKILLHIPDICKALKLLYDFSPVWVCICFTLLAGVRPITSMNVHRVLQVTVLWKC